MDWNQKLSEFLSKKQSEKQKIIVVYGPTASGKTGLAIEVAKKINSEVISTDSRQIFKGLDIGTGKVTQQEAQGIIHHMIDIIHPNTEYSVGEYKQAAQKHINDIIQKGKIPILCGGTGLYIDSLIYDFDIPKVPASEELRNQLEQEAQEYGNEYVYKKLCDIDPEYAQELHLNNLQYVIRGIEVKMLSGKSKKDFRVTPEFKYDILFLNPFSGEREYLYERINKRVQMMFDDGLIQEVKNILSKYTKDNFGMKTIGYAEVIDFLEGNISEQECIELVQKHNRNYAKRQITWFKKYFEY